MANLTPISLESLSFETILSDLRAWIKSKPEGAAWQDFYDSSDGTIIAEWIAGLATFRAYQELIRVRESQLDSAQLPTSIYNLAFNRGLLVPPGKAPELLLTLDLPENAMLSVDTDDYVGMVGPYDLYSLESKTMSGGRNTLKVVVGRLNEFEQQISSMPKFKLFEFVTPDPYLAVQMERFIANTDEVLLQSDPNFLKEVKNDFLLRRTLPGIARIYVGNGVLGWYRSNVTRIQYRVLTYADDITQILASAQPTVSIDALLVSYEVTKTPTFAPEKEDIRAIARFYPLDGRIVTDADYEAVILKFFGGIVHDVYSYNTDPQQQIHIIKRPSFDMNNGEVHNLREIKNIIDSKRALGMQTIYHLYSESQGIAFSPVMKIQLADYTNQLVAQVNKYLADKCFKFLRETKTMTATDLAIELSAEFSIEFKPTNPTASVSITPMSFFQVLRAPLTT